MIWENTPDVVWNSQPILGLNCCVPWGLSEVNFNQQTWPGSSSVDMLWNINWNKKLFFLCLFSFMKHMKMKVVVPVLPSLCQKIWLMVISITRKKCINLGLCDAQSTDLEGTTLVLVTSLLSPLRSENRMGYWNMNSFVKVMYMYVIFAWQELPIHNNSYMYTTCDCMNFPLARMNNFLHASNPWGHSY